MKGYPDPSGLQQQVDDIMGHPARARRGTTDGNARGGSEDRRKRREWLVQTYRADCDVAVILGGLILPVLLGHGLPACRCYRCGRLLTVDTVTVDRIVPGRRGGTYRRNNIRPACGTCNSSTGTTTHNGAAPGEPEEVSDRDAL